MTPWIAVDLDGTLAEYSGWQGELHIGAPIPAMVARVRAWLDAGREVRIFTARAAGGGRASADPAVIAGTIQAWCNEHIGQVLPITATKDYGMIELWDDRAVQVIANTGRRADGQD